MSVAPTPTPPSAGERARRTILIGETPDAAHVPTGCRFHPRCPLAFDRCTREEPPLFDVGGGQQAACWLAEGGRSLPAMPGTADVAPVVLAAIGETLGQEVASGDVTNPIAALTEPRGTTTSTPD